MKNFLLLLLGMFSVQGFSQTVSPKTSKIVSNPRTESLRSALLTKTINLEALTEWLCPSRLLRGDRDFNGNGPKVKCEASLRISRDSSALELTVKLWAQETVHDWSTTEGTWKRIIYEAPYGQKIRRIVSDRASRTQFISPKAGYQIFAPGADVAKAAYAFLDYTDIKSAVLSAHGEDPRNKSALSNLIFHYVAHSNSIVKVPAVEGNLVKFFHIVGDTGAEDISTDDNCNDDTRIHKIEFFPVQIEMVVMNQNN